MKAVPFIQIPLFIEDSSGNNKTLTLTLLIQAFLLVGPCPSPREQSEIFLGRYEYNERVQKIYPTRHMVQPLVGHTPFLIHTKERLSKEVRRVAELFILRGELPRSSLI